MTPEEALEIKKPTTEETLQSIDSTLKRIEKMLETTLKETYKSNSNIFINSLTEGIQDALVRAAESTCGTQQEC